MSPRSKPEEQRPFFAYGTLLPGQPNARLWADAIVSSQPATFVGGRLYDMGSYPMLVGERDGLVYGRLLSLNSARYHEIMTKVDALEGFDEGQPEASAYRRVVREVKMGDGFRVPAWVYLGKAEYVVGAVHIKSGNWPHYVGAKMSQIYQWWREIDTVSGLHGPGK